MALRFRARQLQLGIEAVSGQYENLDAANHSIETRGLEIQPLDTETEPYDYDKASLGAYQEIITSKRSSLTFETFLQTNKKTDNPIVPGWADCLKACGFAESAVAVAGIAAWAANTAYKVGQRASEGGKYYLCIQDHNAADGNKPGAAGGANYWKQVYAYKILKPISEDFKSASASANLSGQRFRFKSLKGNATCEIVAGQLPKMGFTLNGYPHDRATHDAAAFNRDAYKVPTPITKDTVPVCKLFGDDLKLNNLNFDLGNQIEFIDEPNNQVIEIVDRQVTGSLTVEAEAINKRDWFDAIENSESGALMIRLGQNYGLSAGWQLDAPNVTINNGSFSEDANRLMIDLDVSFVPTEAGNDDLQFTFF